MIEVTAEPEHMKVCDRESCVFCRTPTPFWYTPNDVACCKECARNAQPEDVPTKKQWMRRERIADHSMSGRTRALPARKST